MVIMKPPVETASEAETRTLVPKSEQEEHEYWKKRYEKYYKKPQTNQAESHLQYHNAHIVTLPKRFVEYLGWKKYDRLKIELDTKRNILVVRKPEPNEQ